jgi:MoaA/NifB/PqqE/SkfB family radical SAM enzyme
MSALALRTAELTRAVLSSGPSYMVLFVTAVCNARCPMCFYWEQIESANAKLELSQEELEKVARSLGHLYYLSIGGGEPFIRKDLAAIVAGFHRYARTQVVAVATHGGFPDRVQRYVEQLSREHPGLQLRIQVSIDHLREGHDENRRVPGLFDHAMETLRRVAALRDAGAPVMLSVATVLTPKNRGDLTALRAYLDANVPYDDLTLIFPRGNAQDPSLKEVSLDEYRAAKRSFDARRGGVSGFARLYRAVDREAKRGIESFLASGPDAYPWTCVAGEKMITLTEKGELIPCEMLSQIDPARDSGLGNVRAHGYDVPAMLAADKARKVRNFIVESHCACSYECAALCNTAFSPGQWPALARATVFDRE